MTFQKPICFLIFGIYTITMMGDSIIKQVPMELDDGITPIFATAVSGTTTSFSVNFTL